MQCFFFKNLCFWDFPGGPVVKNPPSNAGKAGSIPGRGTKIRPAAGQLSQCATTTEPARSGAHATPREKPTRHNKISYMPQGRSHMQQLRHDAAQ